MWSRVDGFSLQWKRSFYVGHVEAEFVACVVVVDDDDDDYVVAIHTVGLFGQQRVVTVVVVAGHGRWSWSVSVTSYEHFKLWCWRFRSLVSNWYKCSWLVVELVFFSQPRSSRPRFCRRRRRPLQRRISRQFRCDTAVTFHWKIRLKIRLSASECIRLMFSPPSLTAGRFSVSFNWEMNSVDRDERPLWTWTDWMNGWMNEWMNGWMDKQMDGWVFIGWSLANQTRLLHRHRLLSQRHGTFSNGRFT